MVRRVEGQCCRGASSVNSASLPCSSALSRSCRIVENAEPICGLSVCSTAAAIFLRKLAFRHEPHYLGRGGYPLRPLLTQAPNSQMVMGTYQDGIESYSFTGQGYGFSVLITSQTGGAKLINYFAFDGGPDCPGVLLWLRWKLPWNDAAAGISIVGNQRSSACSALSLKCKRIHPPLKWNCSRRRSVRK